ncbi:hypothetical protein [Roseateles terrae]|uniref:Uncharacterized protein n=1 Tax=Roseateles terrae TaxID=431060 RepID=A0ABR6GTR9_9BURK|nr:hypothetical protein [Roseateles terrae]MBB3195497.1 hypothetical protein [Roseateles terrae]
MTERVTERVLAMAMAPGSVREQAKDLARGPAKDRVLVLVLVLARVQARVQVPAPPLVQVPERPTAAAQPGWLCPSLSPSLPHRPSATLPPAGRQCRNSKAGGGSS